MIGVVEILAACHAHGVRLAADDEGGLTVDAPQDALTPDLLGRLKAHKAELLAILQAMTNGEGVDPSGTVDDLEADALNRFDTIRQYKKGPEIGPDGWPVDSIDAGELASCRECGTLELWQTLAGNWRCQRCDPPATAERLRKRAESIRRHGEIGSPARWRAETDREQAENRVKL